MMLGQLHNLSMHVSTSTLQCQSYGRLWTPGDLPRLVQRGHKKQATRSPCVSWQQADAVAARSPEELASRSVKQEGSDESQSASLAQLQQQLSRQYSQHQRWEPFVTATDAEGRAKKLTADISHKKHWSQLQNCWLDNAAAFSPIHFTATLCRLARLVAKQGIEAADRPEVFKFSSALLSAARECIPQLDSRGLAQCFWAYAKLQSAAPHSSSAADAAAATLAAALLQNNRIQQLQPEQLSQAAWAAATLQEVGMPVPAGWWGAVGTWALQLVLWDQLKPSEMACCVWAITKGNHRLPVALAAAVQDHVAAAAQDYGQRELLQVMLALATSQGGQHQQHQQPEQQQASGISNSTHTSTSSISSSSWRAACYARLQQLAPYLSSLEVSTALLALSRLGARNTHASHVPTGCHQLPVPLASGLLKRAMDTLPSSCPRALVTTAYALAKLQLNPGPWWWASWLPYSAAALHVCSPSMLANLAWSLSRVGVEPGGVWLQEMLLHAGYKMQGFGAQEITMLTSALGRWRACPEPWWWAAWEDATHNMLSNFTAAELAALLCGMGNTSLSSVQQPVLDNFFAPFPQNYQHHQHHHQQQQVAGASGLLSSAGVAAEVGPSGAWTAALLLCAQRALSGAPAGTLGGIAMGLGMLSIQPSSTWLDTFEHAVLAALPQASLKDVAAVLWGLAYMRAQPSRELVQAVDVRVMDSLDAAPQYAARMRCVASNTPSAAAAAPADAALGVADDDEQLQQWAGVLGSYATPAPLAAAGAAAATRGCSRPSAAVAAQLLWSVAWLPEPQGVAAWADDLLEGVMPALQEASQHTLFVLLRSLAWLKHAPGCRHWMGAWWQAYAAHLPATPRAVVYGMSIAPASPAAAAAAAASANTAGAIDSDDGNSGSSAGGHLVGGYMHAAQQHKQLGCSLPKGQQYHQQLNKLQYSPAAEQLCYQLTVMLWCFKQLRMPPMSTGWLHTVAAVTQPLLLRVSAERFTLLLLQLAELHVWPGEAWLEAAAAAFAQHKHRLTAQQVEQASVSMERLGWGVQ